MSLDLDAVKRLIARVIRWAVIESSGDDSGTYQVQQISYLQRSGDSVAAYPYGMSALAPAEALAILMTISNQSDARAHIPISGKDRPRLKPGEVVVYHPVTGSKVYLKADGSIEVASGTAVVVTAPAIGLEGDTTVTGDQITTGDLRLDGALNHDGTTIGFRGATPTTLPVITGGLGGSLALGNLLAALDLMGIIDDQT